MGIKPRLSLVEFKVYAAIAGRDGSTAADFHLVGVAPVLGTAVGGPDIEIGEFFFHMLSFTNYVIGEWELRHR